jgi:D-3-phosphoglycerate dehydrogenase / 2-oxoglutarate reductase
MRIAISTSSFGKSSVEAVELLKNKGVEIVQNPYGRRLTESEIIEHLSGVHGLLAGLEPLNEHVLSQATNLKALARIGVGMANVDISAAEKLGIKVSNTPDGPTFAVAEMTLTALLALLRNLPYVNTAMHRGEWPKTVNSSLSGKKLLIIGFGRIGAKFAEMARIFQPEIFVYDKQNIELPDYVQKISLDEGLTLADIVSIHAAGESEILNIEKLLLMKKGSYLLNSSRGALVNESALIEKLSDETIKGAWFDAFWEEPYQGELLKHDNVILTPHTSTYTDVCRASMEMSGVQNIIRDLGI